MSKKKALGRGLGALIGDADTFDLGGKPFFVCDVHSIRPNPYQPRRTFSETELKSLVESIREQGIIQPLIVRAAHGGYELIAGERRLRAARLAGLDEVPVVVKEVSSEQMLEMALIENVQREDLNPIEKADAYCQLIEEFGLTQEQVSERVGQDRSTVANFVRLRSLPKETQADVINGVLTMGHARALLGITNPAQQKEAWRRVVAKGLSVRATESMVRSIISSAKPPTKAKIPSSEEIYLQSVIEDLIRHLGTKVRVTGSGKQRRLEIEFYGYEELDRLVSLLKNNGPATEEQQ